MRKNEIIETWIHESKMRVAREVSSAMVNPVLFKLGRRDDQTRNRVSGELTARVYRMMPDYSLDMDEIDRTVDQVVEEMSR